MPTLMALLKTVSRRDASPFEPAARLAGPRPTRSPLRLAACAAVCAAVSATTLLAACTQYGPVGVAPGLPMAGVVQRMGEPNQIHALDNGARRLEYARGPIGLHTYMVDIDAADQVSAVAQVLTEEQFKAVQPGMARDELLRTLGRPMRDFPVPRNQESWWFYRFDDFFCRWFVVTVTEPTGVVKETGYQPDPRCKKVRD